MSAAPHLSNGEIWGIVGGVGPLASAEFLSTIYRYGAGRIEQELPRVLLLSDPTIPDRTTALLRGEEAQLANAVALRAERLLAAGATKLVLCCVSVHPVLPLLPAHVRDRVVSLVDVIFAAVERTDTRHLMLCTEGTRQMRLFERHERWRVAGNRIVMPDVADQRAIHALIYDIKMHRSWRGELKFVIDAMARYGVESCIAGCTEMHILAARCHAHARLAKRFVCVDPLEIIASQMSCPVATV